MASKDEIRYGAIVEVMQGKSVYLADDPDVALSIGRAGSPQFAVPLNYLAILSGPMSKRGVRKKRMVVKVEWGGQKLWASYKDLRYGTRALGS